MASTDRPHCPETGQPMSRGVRPVALTYKDESATVDMPGWYCETCDEGIHTQEDLKTSDRALTALKARAERLLEPSEIRRVRQKLRLTQQEAGRVIGGGPNAFQKYEAGDTLPSRAISNFLKVLERHPEEVSFLRDEAAPN
jgi:HTH-type transcriptional regulator/antitoxin MqsA